MDESTQTRISENLPNLLKLFALKVGYNAPTQMHRDVMTFVHKHRGNITATFTEIGFKQHNQYLNRITDSDKMSLDELLGRWFGEKPFEQVPVQRELEDIAPGDITSDMPQSEARDDQSPENALREVDDDVLDAQLLALREFVFDSEAYNWLLTRLQGEFQFISTEPNTIQAIRDKIISALTSAHRVSRREPSQTCSATFELDWDILEFFEAQAYSKKPDEIFEGVITLTGSCGDTQATTCAQYIRQTWPVTGEVTIQLIKGALHGGNGHLQQCKLSDGTILIAQINKPKFMVTASGVAASIVETGEQVAWLGAALRTSPRQSGVIHCLPAILNIVRNSAPLDQSGIPPLSTSITCEIGFTMEEVPQPLTTTNGQCWHGAFRNPVVVKGYPIPQRSEWGTGLEIPLDIMAALVRTQRVDRFRESTYIKGFSTMLVLMKRVGDILCWHLLYKKDGSRISYLDDHLDKERYTGRSDLEGLRHVVGWCSEAKSYAGSAEAHYPVTHSLLPNPEASERCALAEVTVSVGRMIKGSLVSHIGARETPLHISHDDHIRQLDWLSASFVLLWDEGDKRGWLVNGESALLHVLRAFIAHKGESYRSRIDSKSKDLDEAESPYTANSESETLHNRRNQLLRLYEMDDGNGGYLLKNQIDIFYNLLEKLIDHQPDITEASGKKLSGQERKYLEGWEFDDLVQESKLRSIRTRVTTLDGGGKGWVDFIRTIQAVTLFGCGFGDIIKPTGTNLCGHWAQLPTRQYYIASCLSDLMPLAIQAGIRGNHVRLGRGFICHTETTTFMTCRCKRTPDEGRCEPVQELFPSAMSKELEMYVSTKSSKRTVSREPVQSELFNELLLTTQQPEPRRFGAVIFGHHSNFPWIWGDKGNPRKGKLLSAEPLSQAVKEDSNSRKDSGIGSSLEGSESEGPASYQPKPTTRPSAEPLSKQSSQVSIGNKTYTPSQYTVAIICALPKELMVVRALFDDSHGQLKTPQGDDNQYALGLMAGHMVVAACLPAGRYGTNSAANVASNMKTTFIGVQFCLLVGIAGGVPSEKHDIRLGDVVVSQPTGDKSGVLQYDLGKEEEDGYKLTGMLDAPPRRVNTAISMLQSDPKHLQGGDPLGPYLRILARLPGYDYPGQEHDVLSQTACAACTPEQASPESCSHIWQRATRTTSAPKIHYGLVGSGNSVMKDAVRRDELAAKHNMLCFEMEAAGVINTLSCLVIRGICDYCDGQKNDTWQEYAAATAAAYAKLLLSVVAGHKRPNVDNEEKSYGEPLTKRQKL
ncbi:Conidiophore development regulator abaB [Cladobotryum mycophilum]|uniref:Conidiophore development regulator abaB n=1 Tax=Cladobotryum mycophilum TaxID=491253 RepID=A0ABR0SZU4_9HYPO